MLEPRLMLKDIRIEVRPDVHWNKGGGRGAEASGQEPLS